VSAEHRGVPRGETPKRAGDVLAGDRVVDETALVAPVHTCKVDGPSSNASNNVVVDVAERVEELLAPHPAVERVELVGSRGRGEATALSDWDFQVHTNDARALARDLPALVRPLEPLAAQWDRLVDRAVYMLMLPGPTKVDLFPGDERHEIEPPWAPTPANLAAIDAHFWDWTLWLGSKVLHGRTELVDEELRKLHDNLLGPLGVADPPPSVDAAIEEYRRARDRLEREWNLSIERELGDEVSAALRRNGVIGRA
jgi:predicted nucleotidyltransferase